MNEEPVEDSPTLRRSTRKRDLTVVSEETQQEEEEEEEEQPSPKRRRAESPAGNRTLPGPIAFRVDQRELEGSKAPMKTYSRRGKKGGAASRQGPVAGSSKSSGRR